MSGYAYTYDLQQPEQGFEDRPELRAIVRELVEQQDRHGGYLADLLAAANIGDRERAEIARVWGDEQ